MRTYVLDTNLFFNMEENINLGDSTEDVTINLTNLARKLREKKTAEFYMSPSAVGEFLSFFENKKQKFITDLLSVITIKPPDYSKVLVSGTLFYRLIEDIRERSLRGLRIGEEEILNAGKNMLGSPSLIKKDFELKIGEVIKKFRDRYRNATRKGFIDSIADLDCIFLAKEQDGCVVSTDEGVLCWSRIFGVKELPPAAWKKTDGRSASEP